MSPSTEGQLVHPSDTAAALVDDIGLVTHLQLAADCYGLRQRVPEGAVVALQARRARTVAAALTALDGWAERVDLLGSRDAADADRDAVVLDDSATEADSATQAQVEDTATGVDRPGAGQRVTTWRLFTSGTTGAPKPVDHTVSSLSRTVRPPVVRPGSQRRWGLLYEPTRMAGLQVILQSLTSADVLLDATSHGALIDRLRWLADHRVQALSATPTVWRQLLQSGHVDDLELSQITLGGEIADQRVLDALSNTFPRARVTHIFASTETGAAFAVKDGLEGFPLAYLDDAPAGVRLEVRDGILFVHAPGVAGAGPDGFVSTGDLVETSADRVRFLGRASGVVNVGGVMVSPEQVEAVLRTHPDVSDAVVTSRRNAFSGAILVADVVPAPAVDTRQLPATLRAMVAGRLSSVHVPASITVVPTMATTATGKAGRR